jgi:hypothetical protein
MAILNYLSVLFWTFIRHSNKLTNPPDGFQVRKSCQQQTAFGELCEHPYEILTTGTRGMPLDERLLERLHKHKIVVAKL